MPLFIKERTPWVEFSRIPDGEHPLERWPISGNDQSKKWWRHRCDNCGRWHHLASMCDQWHVQLSCALCGLYLHEAHECARFREANLIQLPVGDWTDANGETIVVPPTKKPKTPTPKSRKAKPEKQMASSTSDNGNGPETGKPSAEQPTKTNGDTTLGPAQLQTFIQQQMANFFAKYTPGNGGQTPPITPTVATKEVTPSPPKIAALSLTTRTPTQSSQEHDVTDDELSADSSDNEQLITKVDKLKRQLEAIMDRNKKKHKPRHTSASQPGAASSGQERNTGTRPKDRKQVQSRAENNKNKRRLAALFDTPGSD